MLKTIPVLLILFLIFNIPSTRQQLIDIIFGGNLPIQQPDIIQIDIPNSPWNGLLNLARVDRLTVEMDHDLYSIIDLLIPVDNNRQLLIYHEGHGADPIVRRDFIAQAVGLGFTVAAMAMPLSPINGGPRVQMTVNGEMWQVESHNALAYLPPASGHPIRYFLEPVIVLLNYTAGQYSHTSMVGLSGGGWTTTLAAAIDSRIERSYPVAGSLPLGLRYAGDWGDWEQGEADIYSLAGYEDLYLLAACNGRQLQILNRTDSCCFRADGREANYAPTLKKQASDLGCSWDLWIDDYLGHNISPAAANRIFGDILGMKYYLPVLLQ